MKEISIEELISRFQRGDESAYVILVNRLKNRLFNFILGMVSDRINSEDILQNVFIKLYNKKHMYNPQKGKFTTWLYSIAKREVYTYLRREKIRKLVNKQTKVEEEKKIWDPEDIDADKFEKKLERWQDILSALQSVPLVFRTVLILRDFQELKYEEISIIVNVNIGTVRSRLNRGRLHLKKLVKERI